MNSNHPTWLELKSKFDAESIVKDILSCYLFEKEGKLQEVIHLLKYRGVKSVGIMLGEDIGRKISVNNLFAGADYLIPVPLHKLKQRERGYNQSEFICKGISKITDIPINTTVVNRTKYTQSQTQLNLVERKENVGDAFKINEKVRHLVQGKTFLIVDDVITTGATINSCAKELLAAGASSILVASAALAQ
ncbi:MAG: ComF family protein [Ignavibacteriales bacterium]|nr:ComF family protein [Ignavibacteriales bacterium]